MKFVLLITFISLLIFSCEQKAENLDIPPKTYLTKVEWIKANNFISENRINPPGLLARYEILGDSGKYTISVDLIPDTSVVKREFNRIRERSGLNSDKFKIWVALDGLIGDGSTGQWMEFGYDDFMNRKTPTSAKNMKVFEKNSEDLFKNYPIGSSILILLRVSPTEEAIEELRKIGVYNGDNQREFIYHEYVNTRVGWI